MATGQEIRRANLALLLDECARELGTRRGAAAELARRSGVPGPQISQFLNQRMHQGGKARSLGDDSARKLERGMNKPIGWMDVEHGPEPSAIEREFLALLRLITPDQRELLKSSAREYARLNGSLSTETPVVPVIRHH